MAEVVDLYGQSALLQLYSGLRVVDVRDGVLRIVAAKPASQLVEAGMVLVDRFLGRGSEGIDFIGDDSEAGRVRICDEASCPVCGETVESAPVYCSKCHLPHHKECWKYAGGCAIYGCGGRLMRKVRPG